LFFASGRNRRRSFGLSLFNQEYLGI